MCKLFIDKDLHCYDKKKKKSVIEQLYKIKLLKKEKKK